MQEMYARGFEFMPIDVYEAQADAVPGHRRQDHAFVQLNTTGLGDKAAAAVVDAAKDGPFLVKGRFSGKIQR